MMPTYPQMNSQPSQPERGNDGNLELVDIPARAGFIVRWEAMILDTLVLLGATSAIFLPMMLAISFLVPQEFAGVAVYLFGLLLLLMVLPACWLYEAIFLSSVKQATPGKRMLGIYVTDLNGNRLTFARATGRFFARIFCTLLTFKIGYLMAAFTEKKQGLHDMVAGTLVYKGKPAQLEKPHQLIR